MTEQKNLTEFCEIFCSKYFQDIRCNPAARFLTALLHDDCFYCRLAMDFSKPPSFRPAYGAPAEVFRY